MVRMVPQLNHHEPALRTRNNTVDQPRHQQQRRSSMKIDAFCEGCQKQVKASEVVDKGEQQGTDGGHIIHHNCPGKDVGGSFLAWKGEDGVWRKEKPPELKKKGDRR